eukprot:snap_masked-scaffold374_size191929-processed-gene-0.18 protein:Tk01260 transcript:snap_masked-scaffold374_size191929-processed-gene-0.18-mRNA-1 annotation:"periplasmic solute binding family protein"
MRPNLWFGWAGVLVVIALCIGDSWQTNSTDNGTNQAEQPIQTEGTPRVFTSFIFPFFRQYQSIDLGQNLNNLKSPNTMAFFVIRDAVAYLALVTTWILMHTIFWDGRLKADELDRVPLFIRLLSGFVSGSDSMFRRSDEGGDVPEDEFQTRFGYTDQAEEKLIAESLPEISANGIFNFFADPNPSFRNLIMNSGFLAFQLIIWFLPTFFWPGSPLPTPQNMNQTISSPGEGIGIENPLAQNRVGAFVHNLGEASPVAIHNRLLCPQCFVQTISISTLLYAGKLFWWWWFSSIPDFKRFSIRPSPSTQTQGRHMRYDDDDDDWNWTDVALSSIHEILYEEIRLALLSVGSGYNECSALEEFVHGGIALEAVQELVQYLSGVVDDFPIV